MLDSVHLLLPRPRKATTPGGHFTLPDRPTLSYQSAAARTAGRRLVAELEDLGAPGLTAAAETDADVRLELDGKISDQERGFPSS